MFVDFGARQNHLASVRDERACSAYDNKQKRIQALSDEMFKRLSDDDFNDISEKIRISLGFNDIDTSSLTETLKSICYSEAERLVNKN